MSEQDNRAEYPSARRQAPLRRRQTQAVRFQNRHLRLCAVRPHKATRKGKRKEITMRDNREQGGIRDREPASSLTTREPLRSSGIFQKESRALSVSESLSNPLSFSASEANIPTSFFFFFFCLRAFELYFFSVKNLDLESYQVTELSFKPSSA